jgi:hypothetical protein
VGEYRGPGDELVEAVEDFRAGRMGTIPAEHTAR